MDVFPSRRNAIITFDYEVFLGRNTGTVEKSVIIPTNSIIKILKEKNARAIFFVDTTWLFFLKKYLPDDFRRVALQLKGIVESGSSVELHLHPQWLQASVTGGKIVFGPAAEYKLHSLGRAGIVDLFSGSVNLLKSITGREVKCFRAGGWCIDPFTELKEAFLRSGISHDFSVVPGVILKEGKNYDYDFSKAPDLPFYRFQEDVFRPEQNGIFTEVPLCTYNNSPFLRVINKVLLKLQKDSVFGDGTGGKERSIGSSLSRLTDFSKSSLSLDRTSNMLFRYILWTAHRKTEMLVIVSHPKIISNQALKNLAYIAGRFNTHNSESLDMILSQ